MYLLRLRKVHIAASPLPERYSRLRATSKGTDLPTCKSTPGILKEFGGRYEREGDEAGEVGTIVDLGLGVEGPCGEGRR